MIGQRRRNFVSSTIGLALVMLFFFGMLGSVLDARKTPIVPGMQTCTLEQAKVGCTIRRVQEKNLALVFEYYAQLPERFRYQTSYLRGLYDKGGVVLVVSFVVPREGGVAIGGNTQIDTLLRIQKKVIEKYAPPGTVSMVPFQIVTSENGKETQMYTVIPVKFVPSDFFKVVPELT